MKKYKINYIAITEMALDINGLMKKICDMIPDEKDEVLKQLSVSHIHMALFLKDLSLLQKSDSECYFNNDKSH